MFHYATLQPDSDVKYHITVILNVKKSDTKPKTIEDVIPEVMELGQPTNQSINPSINKLNQSINYSLYRSVKQLSIKTKLIKINQ